MGPNNIKIKETVLGPKDEMKTEERKYVMSGTNQKLY
tara:strand:+ start:139 stop:249 length:111 start_codon:yes stop_codon:yes gene_type:complete